MAEIMNTIETIEEISIYVRVFPHNKQNISRLNYLKYHVNNYLNEIYILKNRLNAYLTTISRAYSKSEYKDQVSETIVPIFELIAQVFKSYIEIRGSHVHEKRYSDKEFSRLSTLELLSKSNDEFGQIMTEMYLQNYKKTRKTWISKIDSDINAIKKLLDIYFSKLLQIVFRDGHLLVPDNHV